MPVKGTKKTMECSSSFKQQMVHFLQHSSDADILEVLSRAMEPSVDVNGNLTFIPILVTMDNNEAIELANSWNSLENNAIGE